MPLTISPDQEPPPVDAAEHPAIHAAAPGELEQQRRVAADPGHPLDERLEAFEDILDSEVGDTTLSRARNIEREVGLRQIYLKFEGGNPPAPRRTASPSPRPWTPCAGAMTPSPWPPAVTSAWSWARPLPRRG